MKLHWLRLDGFRRFKEETTLRLSGKLVALVGPNEAGKSSALAALQIAGRTVKFSEESDINDERADDPPDTPIEVGFLLTDEERALLPSTVSAKQLLLRIGRDGAVSTELHPRPDRKNTRSKLAILLEGVLDDRAGEEVFKILRSDRALSPEELAAMIRISKTLPDPSVDDLARAVQWQIGYEQGKATGPVAEFLPQIHSFTPEDLRLEWQYALRTYFGPQKTSGIPVALMNLARASGLDLLKLFRAVETDNEPKQRERLVSAERRLTALLQKNWNQPEPAIEVSLSLASGNLRILVNADDVYSRLADRSDGLRRFLALLCFLEARQVQKVPPVLLVDEAETHLHYDAQAELIEYFTRQQCVAKIVYTTHSIGCLPNDLGGGVRFLCPRGRCSVFVNNLWHPGPSNEASRRVGFEPLLYSLGATRMAFVPLRSAVLVEGTSDMIILPVLFRQVAELEELPFQIVGNLSELSKSEITLLGQADRHMVCLLDNDEGGKDLAENIHDIGLPRERTLFLPLREEADCCTLEDCVDATLFANVASELLREFQQTEESVDPSDVARAPRAVHLDEWCISRHLEVVSKRDLAARILERVHESPELSIVDAEMTGPLRELFETLCQKLDV